MSSVMRWFFKSDFRSLWLLNATQFLGALNDNLFKLLVIYLQINVRGAGAAPLILSAVGAIFVIPFLLFSSGAGILADRISKRTIIVVTKFVEVVVTIFGLIVVMMKSTWGCYFALFLMASHSAVFGPSKYGVIPELVEPKKVSKANGSITSLTYLAIILGTFLASFLTDITKKNFVVVNGFCIFVAIMGFIASLGIRKTAAQGSSKKMTPLFLVEVYKTLKFSRSVRHLFPAIMGSAFFLFVAAFAQLNIIPFAMQSLHMSEVGGGYLFLPTAIGIAIGAVLAGQLSKDKVEPGISCICSLFMGLLFLSLWIFAGSLITVIIILTLLGVFGGAFLIPFDAFIQVNSPDEKRGQVIATSSFLSFFGVLMASFCLYAISEKLGFSAASGFGFMGLFTLIATFILTGRLSTLFFPFFVRKILKKFRTMEITPAHPKNQFFVLQSNSWWDALMLFPLFPNLKILLPHSPLTRFPWFNHWFDSIQFVSPETDEDLKEAIQTAQEQPLCLFFRKATEETTQKTLKVYEPFLEEYGVKLTFARGKKVATQKRFLFWRYAKKHIVLTFGD